MKNIKFSYFNLTVLVLFFAIMVAFGQSRTVNAVTPPVDSNPNDNYNVVPLPEGWRIYTPWEIGQPSKIDGCYYNDTEGGCSHVGRNSYALDFNPIDDYENVYSIAPGDIVYKGNDPNGYGNYVVVRHIYEEKYYYSIYAHLLKTFNVPNNKIEPGNFNQALGIEGSTGDSSGPHLHFLLLQCPTENFPGLPATECSTVVPEPMIGEQIYEGLGWLYKNHRLDKPEVREKYYPISRRPDNYYEDTIPPTGNWLGNSAQNFQEISPSSPYIDWDIYIADDIEGQLGEVRLTIYYAGWADLSSGSYPYFNESKVWHIVARCDASISGTPCSGNHWHYRWDPYKNSGETVYSDSQSWDGTESLLDTPWLPKLPSVLGEGKSRSACISFDLFDKFGNRVYSDGGYYGSACEGLFTQNDDAPDTKFSSNDVGSSNSYDDSSFRLINILPYDSVISILDKMQYVSLNYPSGSQLSPNQSFEKKWSITNTGQTTWNSNYKLIFSSGESMGGGAPISMPSLAPGESFTLPLSLVASSSGGLHSGTWRLRNAQGQYFGSALQVQIDVVATSSKITVFTTSPSSPADTNRVEFYAKAVDIPNFRAMRILVDGESKCEIAAPEIYCTWDTTGYSIGAHSVVVQATDFSDLSWARPQSRAMQYTLEGTGAPANHAPYRPTLTSPYDWYTYYSGNTAELCAQNNGDPDGDNISGYYFEIYESPQAWNSGWSSSPCVTTSALGPYDYKWHVKVKDTYGAESPWSDDWHFTIVNPTLSITNLSFTPIGGNYETIRINACTAGQGGIGITLRVSVNDAADGSGNGEWHIIKELGVPCFTEVDAPIWDTLDYEDGTHRVRVEAHGIQTGWNGAAVMETTYSLPSRRPGHVELAAPVPSSRDLREPIYLNDETITFQWNPALRADNYTVYVDTSPSPQGSSTPIVSETIAGDITSYTFTFDQPYPNLYWQVSATNALGTTGSGDQQIGIDVSPPTCAIDSLPETSTENVIPVHWSGTDNISGIAFYDIQYMDSVRGEWVDWLIKQPADVINASFNGLPGHDYYFRCRSWDNAENVSDYPDSAQTGTTIDLTSNTQGEWALPGYAHKRNITVLNRLASLSIVQDYPIRLLLNSTTSPTAAEIFNSSLSTPKCDDVRIVYNDSIELERYVSSCSASSIDIWFRLNETIAGNASTSNYQVYYGNANPGSPPGNPGNVFHPSVDANTVASWYTLEGPGYSTTNDSSGHNYNCTLDGTTSWVSPGKFPYALDFLGGTDGPTVNCGSHAAYNLQNFTFELYFRGTQNNIWGRMAGHIQPTSQRWMLDEIENKPNLRLWTVNGGAELRASRAYNDNQWHHLAVTVSGTTARMYIDGTLDGSVTLPGLIRSDNLPLTIGSAENGGRSFTELTGVRLSNVARTSFEYGAFAKITTEPSVAAGAEVDPPVPGTVDLEVVSLTATPYYNNAYVVSAFVMNNGSAATPNGFYTDLFINDLPLNPNDFSGSIGFWVNDSILPGEQVQLTQIIPDVGRTVSDVLADSTISSKTDTSCVSLYVVVDSSGVVSEEDGTNNSLEANNQLCISPPDTYENDNTLEYGSQLIIGLAQEHNFHEIYDLDWGWFSAEEGKYYVIRSFDLGLLADTNILLLDDEGVLIDQNDDYMGSKASTINFRSEKTGSYHVLTLQWNPLNGGVNTSYKLVVEEVNKLFLPILIR